MKNFIFTIALMLTFTFGVQAQYTFNPRVKVQPQVKINPNLLQKNCPDLAAVEIKVEKISGGAYSGNIRITGIVKNVGKQNFSSNPKQMQIILYEVSLTGRTRVKARTSIGNIPAGRAVQLSHVRNWSTTNEFPPNYRLAIVYDPDIKLDSNPRNDDCNSANNRMTREGADIHRIFRAGR